MATKYTDIFHAKALENKPKSGFFEWKYTILGITTVFLLSQEIWEVSRSNYVKPGRSNDLHLKLISSSFGGNYRRFDGKEKKLIKQWLRYTIGLRVEIIKLSVRTGFVLF
jgi:hypothetical protein